MFSNNLWLQLIGAAAIIWFVLWLYKRSNPPRTSTIRFSERRGKRVTVDYRLNHNGKVVIVRREADLRMYVSDELDPALFPELPRPRTTTTFVRDGRSVTYHERRA